LVVRLDEALKVAVSPVSGVVGGVNFAIGGWHIVLPHIMLKK
jgi:hypothetical protein